MVTVIANGTESLSEPDLEVIFVDVKVNFALVDWRWQDAQNRPSVDFFGYSRFTDCKPVTLF